MALQFDLKETKDLPGIVLRTISLLRKHKLNPGPQVVDLGCGVGRYTLAMASLGYQVTAIDNVPHSLNQMLIKAREYKLVNNIQVTRAPLVENLPFADSSFDFALDLATQDTMTSKDLREYIQEITRIIKPKGLVLFYRSADIGDQPYDIDDQIHQESFTEEQLRDLYSSWEFIDLDIAVRTENYFGQLATRKWWIGLASNQK